MDFEIRSNRGKAQECKHLCSERAAYFQLAAQDLVRPLTRDQGSELAAHHAFTSDTAIPVYFCDPGKNWQHGSDETPNCLLRQHFSKGTDLTGHPREYLDTIAAPLNAKPRKVLNWATPAELLAQLGSTKLPLLIRIERLLSCAFVDGWWAAVATLLCGCVVRNPGGTAVAMSR